MKRACFWRFLLNQGWATFFALRTGLKLNFFADRPSKTHNSAMNIYYNSCKLLQLWFNENLELVLPQRDAPI